MPKKKPERMHKLSAIEGALRLGQQLVAHTITSTPTELEGAYKRALDALEWLRQYPQSLLEPLAALERDQFDGWLGMNAAKREVTANDRAWAKAVIEVFETGSVDLRRKG